MATKRAVTVTGPVGDFRCSRFTFTRLYEGRDGYTLTVDEDGNKPKTKRTTSPED